MDNSEGASVIQHMLKMRQTEKHGWPREMNTPRIPKILKSQGQGIQ